MQTYNQENDKIEKYKDNGREPFFPRSELNDWTPLWEKLCFFFIGWLGIQFISYGLQYICMIIPGATVKDTNGNITAFTTNTAAFLNFFVYFILVLIFLAFLFFDRRKTYQRLFKGFTDPKVYVWALIGLGLVLGSQMVLSYLFSAIFPWYGNNSNQSGIVTLTKAQPFFLFVMTVFFAPFCEEITYRLGLMDAVGHKYERRWLGILLTAVIFGLIHCDLITPISAIVQLQNSSSATAAQITEAYYDLYNELANLPIYMLSGASLAFCYAKSGKIASSMAAHMGNNLISMISIFISIAVSSSASCRFFMM